MTHLWHGVGEARDSIGKRMKGLRRRHVVGEERTARVAHREADTVQSATVTQKARGGGRRSRIYPNNCETDAYAERVEGGGWGRQAHTERDTSETRRDQPDGHGIE